MKAFINKFKNLDRKGKKATIQGLLGIFVLLTFVVGATYAYIKDHDSLDGTVPINSLTATTDLLTFDFGHPIIVEADDSNFKETDGNVSDRTNAIARLTANNSTNRATMRYNIYFIISENDFIYTTETNTPELILRVTDPNNNPVEYITGLVPASGGFDITTRRGGYLLASDYEITSEGSLTEQSWTIEVEFVNLNTKQNLNGGKKLRGTLYITQAQMPTYDPIEIQSLDVTTTYETIDVSLVKEVGTAEVSKYYFGIERVGANVANAKHLSTNIDGYTIDFEESSTPDYHFDNLIENSVYNVYAFAVDTNGIRSNVYATELTTNPYEYATVSKVTFSNTYTTLTANATVNEGQNEILKYWFSCDGGNTYHESSTPTYTFEELQDTTSYNISIRVEDVIHMKSPAYNTSSSTRTYNLPRVSNVSVSTTSSSITLTATGYDGDYALDHFIYSMNNGEWTTNNVFTGLDSETSYDFEVKAVDINDRESSYSYSFSATPDYLLPSVEDVTFESTTSSINLSITAINGENNVAGYMISRDNGSNWTTIESTELTASHLYEGLTSGIPFNIKVKVYDDHDRMSNDYDIIISTLDLGLSNYCTSGTLLSTCLKDNVDNIQSLYYHDTNLAGSAEDNNYRFSGENYRVANFVCFGYDDETGDYNDNWCPKDNLYRMIGVFTYGTDSYVKIMKYTSIGEYPYATSGTSSIWSFSSSVGTYMNGTYRDGIPDRWKSMTAYISWKHGKMNIYAPIYETNKYIYDTEFYLSYSDMGYFALISISDYAYAEDPSKWTTAHYINGDKNWMYTGDNQLTINGYSDKRHYVVGDKVNYYYVGNRTTFNARPVSMLSLQAKYVGGDGSKKQPIRISK